MAKLLKHKPDWFDLSKYNDSNYDLYDWAYNLSVRYKIKESFDKGIMKNTETLYAINKCRENGFLDPEVIKLPINSLEPLTFKNVSELNNHLPKQLSDVSKIYDKMNQLKAISAHDWLDIRKDDQLKNTSVYSENTSYLTVNLEAPLNILIEQFTEHVKIRKSHHKTKIANVGITAEQRDKWDRHQVLAYIDLCLYADEEGKRLTNNVAGEWLFPHLAFRDWGDMIKRNTRPLVKKLLNHTYIKAIVTQSGNRMLF